MKSTFPGIFEKAFPGLFDSDNNHGKGKHTGFNDDFFYQLAQNATDIILHAQILPESKFDYVSPSVTKLIGYTPEDFYKDNLIILKITHPDDIPRLLNQNVPGFKPPVEPVKMRWIRKDGSIIWMEHVITYTQDKAGNYTAFQIIARDITERIKTEEALQENRVFIDSLLENAPHATVVINPDTSIRYVNHAWERLNGWTLPEVIGLKAPYPWWPEEGKDGWLKTFLDSLKQPSGTGELPSIKKNGEVYWIGINWSAIYKNENVDYFLINSVDITERINTQKALKESEEKFSHAFHSSPDMMTITTEKDSRYMEVNETFLRITGYTREEVIGHTPEELNTLAEPLDREKMVEMLNATKRIYNAECLFHTKSGEVHTMLFSLDRIKVGDESCFISVSNDITERKKAEAASRQSEEKFAKAFKSSPTAICILRAEDSLFIDTNESFSKFCGYGCDDIIGHTPNDLNLWVSQEEMAKMSRSLKETGMLVNHRIRTRMKSGEIHTGLFSAQTFDFGEKKHIILSITDITDQVKSSEALRDSEEKFAKAFRNSPEIITITTLKDGKYVDANDSYLKNTGYTREEIIGHSTAQIDIWANEDERDERLRLLIEQGNVRNKEYEFRTKSGDIRTWLYSAELVTIGGEPCMMSASIDITERKRMEQALANEAIRRRILIEQSSDGIVILDQSGKVYDVNWRFAEMLGYTMEEASELYVWDWEANVSRENLMEQLKNINSNGDHFTTMHKRKDGTLLDVDISTNGATFAGQKLIFCVCRDITQRKQMESALRESEEKFSLAFNASPHMVIITDVENNRYLEINDSFVSGTGYSREELLGQKITDIKMWDKPEQTESMLRILQQNGCVRNEVYDFRTKSGDLRTWLCSADVVSLGGKKCMLAVSADITERKAAEEALRESEERFSRAFNASPISLSITRISDGKYIEVNESFLRDKGYTREEIIGKTSTDVPVWASNEKSHKLAADLKAQGRIHNVQMQYVTKSGELRTGLVSAELVKLGNEECMLILNNDITQQMQAEKQLKLLSSVTKQVSDSTIITDPEFNIQFVNQAAVDMFGYTFDELKGKKLSMLNEEIATDEIKNDVMNTLKSGKMHNAIQIKRCKNGSTLICDCRLTPMYDDNGNIISLIDVQRDITRQKDIEAKLQEHKKLIDSILATMPEGVLVVDRDDRILLANKALYDILRLDSKALKNKPLSEVLPLDQYFNIHRAVTYGKANNNTLEFRYNVQGVEKIICCVIVKMGGERTLITFSDVSREREEEEKLYLTDRLASIGEMAAGLAHELNNPLTGILTLSQLLVGSSLPQESKEDAECIYSEAKRAAGIVKNVLLFARNKPEESGRASVNEVVKDVLRLREYEQRSSNIKVVTELEENLPDVVIDKGQLQQVFLNMISNAEAAIKEAGRPGILTVTTQRTNGHINIHFSDNGCGIKKQVMPRIFDPFFTTKEVGKGTGLGLSICYSIVVKHGGKISVKSQVNEGTTFTIKLPVIS